VERSNANLTLEEAVTHVLSSSIHLRSRNTYSSQFAHFFRFCTALGIDCFMRGFDPVAAQEVLVQFIAFKGVVQRYAHATVRVMLFAIHHFHLLNRCPDPLFGAPLYKALKGLRNLQGGSVQKVAATPDLLIEALNELNLDVWDDLVEALGLSVMFVFLSRSSEALSTGGHADPERGLRVQDVTLAAKGKALTADSQCLADELVLLKGKSKADQDGMGHMANAFRTEHPLCPVSLLQRAMRMNPGHFAVKERFLLTKSNGRVLSRDEMAARLRRAGGRLGFPEGFLSVISLRSGGARTMFHEGYSAEEIKRRGRWRSELAYICLDESGAQSRASWEDVVIILLVAGVVCTVLTPCLMPARAGSRRCGSGKVPNLQAAHLSRSERHAFASRNRLVFL